MVAVGPRRPASAHLRGGRAPSPARSRWDV